MVDAGLLERARTSPGTWEPLVARADREVGPKGHGSDAESSLRQNAPHSPGSYWLRTDVANATCLGCVNTVATRLPATCWFRSSCRSRNKRTKTIPRGPIVCRPVFGRSLRVRLPSSTERLLLNCSEPRNWKFPETPPQREFPVQRLLQVKLKGGGSPCKNFLLLVHSLTVRPCHFYIREFVGS